MNMEEQTQKMTSRVSSSLEKQVCDLTSRARKSSRKTAQLDTATKNEVLLKIAHSLTSKHTKNQLLLANSQDLEVAKKREVSAVMLDRLTLNEKRFSSMIQGLKEVAALEDPVGVVRRMWTRPNGLKVGKRTIPLGVIGIIYEARPNVTIDAFSLCFKSGNTILLKGGSEAINSNRALVKTIREALAPLGMEDACQFLDSTNRESVLFLLRQEEDLDLIIPRGGEGLIRFVSENSRIPIIKHYKGVCHLYVDQDADLSMAISIAENAKVSRPSVCNALETLLVHGKIASNFLPAFAERMQRAGVELRGDTQTRKIVPGLSAATEEDYYSEYLDLILSIRIVDSLDEAVAHIEKYGSSHTEAIITENYSHSQKFLDRVNSSVVLVNASTRFSDGGQLGLGAEIGISTTRLHAYGPMGLDGLVTEKFIVFGNGQVRI